MIQPRQCPAIVLLAAIAIFCGCASDPKTQSSRPLTPDDFAGTPSPRTHLPPAATAPAIQPAPPALGASGSDERSDREAEQVLDKLPKPVIVAATAPAPGSAAATYTLDAMVGQVNGQPIYANAVFAPLQEQLTAIGNREPRRVFRPRAKELIAHRLEEIVFDSLILGEAERDLSAQEQQGLQNILKDQREEFLRQFGGGSVAVADTTLRHEENMSLDQKMTATRQKILVKRYLSQKLLPKINVTRKDIERYYQDHYAEYNPPAGRTLRVILVENATQAKSVDAQLSSGVPFKEVAGRNLNQYRPGDNGLLLDTGADAKVFSYEPLNEALAKLKPGEHSPRIQTGDTFRWIFLESINQGKARPLREVQLEIEELLRRQRFQSLSKVYRERLLTQGSYNSLDEMAESLLNVAISRYALPE